MPWIAAVGALAGVAQTVIGGIRARKAREAAEKMKVPTQSADPSVSRYYNEALRRYNTAPTSSAEYKAMSNNIVRNQAAGLSRLRDLRSGIGGVGALVSRSNDGFINAGAQAERDQANRFGQLGSATGAKANDTRALFNQNQLAPYQKNLTLAGMKAAANANTMNTGIQNIYSGLSNYGSMKNGTYKQPEYKDPNLVNLGYGGDGTLGANAYDVVPNSRNSYSNVG
jgi:hypothetical protein